MGPVSLLALTLLLAPAAALAHAPQATAAAAPLWQWNLAPWLLALADVPTLSENTNS